MHTIPPNVYRACKSVGVTQESACEPVGMTQETRDHNYFRTRSVGNKVHPSRDWLRNLEIGTQSQDSENAQCNLEVAVKHKLNLYDLHPKWKEKQYRE